jgi:hypothetical protein
MPPATRVVDEMDDEDDILDGAASLPQRPDGDLPAGLSGEPPPSRQPQQARQPQEPQFEVVETDDRFQPIQRQEQPLSEQAAPPDPNAVQPGEKDEFGRPRVTRAERNRRRRVYQERLESELTQTRAEVEALRTQIGGIEPRLTEIDQGRRADQLATLDRQINEANGRAALARNNLTEALTNQDSAAITAALDMRDEAIRQATILAGQKERLASAAPIQTVDPNQFRQQQPSQQQQRQAPPPLPREAATRATAFQAEHSWIAANPNSREARLILDIDNEIAGEGFDPRTDDYWDELRDRASAYMDLRTGRPLGQVNGNGHAPPQPQRGAQPMQPRVPEQRRGPMVAGGSVNGTPPGNGRQLFLSPDRKAAMIQVGALEPDGRTVADRKKYTRLAERYMAFDRENAPA